MSWETVCNIQDIPHNTGVCALINGRQIAIYRFNDELFALDNYDPFSHANVLSRGILGDVHGQLCVASPIYKQHYSVNSGICLENESVSVGVYAVRQAEDGAIEVQVDELAAA